MFIPNFDLYKTWEDSEKIGRPPYIALFRKDNKTLIYVADRHTANVSFDMVDFCFSKKTPAVPQIVVVEYGQSGRKLTAHSFQDNTLAYAVAVAIKNELPVVFADLSDDEKLSILNKQHPDRKFTTDDLGKILTAGGPSSKKSELNMLSLELNMYGRDPFMVKNITAALNKYDVVMAVFGEGHYRSQRLILEDMLGKPEYITTVQNARGDFDNIEIKSIVLV